MKKQVLSLFLALLLLAALLPQVALTGFAEGESAPTLTMEALATLIQQDDGHVNLDVRNASEYEGGHISGAVNILVTTVESYTEPLISCSFWLSSTGSGW